MAWGDLEQKLKIKGGDICLKCQGIFCLNGIAAMPGEKIVVCTSCHSAFCALCGRAAEEKEVNKEIKYYCSKCQGK